MRTESVGGDVGAYSGHADITTEPLPSFNNAGTLRMSTSDGSIEIAVRFTNTGTIEVLTGILNATASVTFTPESVFRFVISGPTEDIDYGRLNVNGAFTLRGTTQFVLVNGFIPVGDQEFTMITAGSLIDTFSVVQGNVLPNAIFLNPVYTSNAVIVHTQDGRPILQPGIEAPNSHFRINGVAGQMYRIYTVSELGVSDWELIATVTLSGSARLDFVDPEAADFPHRFYIVEFVNE